MEQKLQEPNDVLIIAGRRFRPVANTTFDQDLYIGGLVRQAGIQDLNSAIDLTKFDIGQVAETIIIRAHQSGKLFEILAAVLEEEHVPWTMSEAKKNSQFFAQLTQPEDKIALRTSIATVILGFFINGLQSLQTFKVSLSSPDDSAPGGTIPPDVSGSTNAEGAETMASGMPSSEPSDEMTQGRVNAFFGPGTSETDSSPTSD